MGSVSLAVSRGSNLWAGKRPIHREGTMEILHREILAGGNILWGGDFTVGGPSQGSRCGSLYTGCRSWGNVPHGAV